MYFTHLLKVCQKSLNSLEQIFYKFLLSPRDSSSQVHHRISSTLIHRVSIWEDCALIQSLQDRHHPTQLCHGMD